MATEITDEAGVVSGRMRKVALGQTKYRVPASPTLRYLFWMRRFLGDFAEGKIADEEIVECYEETVAFLRRYNPDVDEQQLQEGCELVDLITFYNRCFGAEAIEDGDERPPRAPTRGTRSSSRARSSRSRS